jgi:proteasome lid subunit RPN8/RPN11
LDLVGIYHSHPSGPEMPSVTDVAEAYYPEAIYLIWSGANGEWTCRGFTIKAGIVAEVMIDRSADI